MLAPHSPGPMIRALRVARRLSQEELAHRASVSTRHLSYLENGRALPSHAMVLSLGSALELPLRERNTLLIAAGFAPVYRVSPLEDPAMAHVDQALTRILSFQEPHPAILLDRLWNVLRFNAGAIRLFLWCGVNIEPGAPVNAHRVLFDPRLGLRQWLVNFDDIADATLERLRTEADVDPSLQELLKELEGLRGEQRPRAEAQGPSPVAIPVHVRCKGRELRYFTTITTLGTPLDVTAQELRIESFFPMDEATEAFAQELAGVNAPASSGSTGRSKTR